jgi:putative phosphoribosyl transferase
MTRYHDRTDAGQALALALGSYADDPDVRVLALPRGGVPVAFEVARALHAPLDVMLVRKLGLPDHEEYAMGAIASGGLVVLDRAVTTRFGVSKEQISRTIARERQELDRREHLYRGDRAPPKITGRTVILVDDGLATGASMHAAASALRKEHPKRIVVAVPIGAPETCDAMRVAADDVVCAATPEPFLSIGLWYDDFSQTTDAEVRDLLERAEHEWPIASE